MSKVQDILSEGQELRQICDGMELEGCMSGRLAMNTPWQVVRIDREIFGDLSRDTPSRDGHRIPLAVVE